MRAYLHLCDNQTDDSVIWQVLNEDYQLYQDDIFEYTEEIFNSLDEEDKKNI